MSELIFLIEEDPEGGYTAHALGHSIFTEGRIWDDLKKNVQEAVRCHFEGLSQKPHILRLHLVRDEVVAL